MDKEGEAHSAGRSREQAGRKAVNTLKIVAGLKGMKAKVSGISTHKAGKGRFGAVAKGRAEQKKKK